ncbi:MAG: hypothetical protein EXR43_03845 [Dehalococcoidia bacterium]|nr:hypothetical protein [Dehalococcoidia bacterium]
MNRPPCSAGPFDHIVAPSVSPPPPVLAPTAAPVALAEPQPERRDVAMGTVIAFALCMAVFVLAFNWWLLTSERVGTAYLRDALVRVTEIDRVALDGETQLRATAAASPDRPVRLRAYPVAVDVPADFVANAGLIAIRDRVLHEAADALYRQGVSATLRGGEPAAVGSFTVSAAIDRVLSAVSPGRHRALTFALPVLALAALIGSALVARGRETGSALRLLGLGVAAGAALVVIGTLELWVLLAVIGSAQEEVLAVGVLGLARDTVLLFSRTSLIIALGGVAIAVAGPVLRRMLPGG